MSRLIVSALLLCAYVCTAHTQEEIDRKGAEVMEEYRRDRGHWIHLSDMSHIDHMVDHIGKNGLAIGGFFITKDKYSSKMPGDAEQNGDPLWVAFKKLAKDQSWLADLGMGHKTWTFGYGHDKAVANEAGCEDVGTYTWDHVCIVVWKTSADGTHLRAWHTSHFDKDFSKVPKPVPTTEDVKKFIHKHAAMKVETTGVEL